MVQQISLGDYRDGLKHSLKRNIAFLEAKTLVDLEATLERSKPSGC